jgi:hypothetical protein
MKKQSVALASLSLMTVINGINGMESPESQIATIKARIKQRNPTFSEAKSLESLLTQVVFEKKEKALELLLKEGVTDETGIPLAIAININFYEGARLLLEYGSPITDDVRRIANAWLSITDKYVKLLQEEEKAREEIR